MSAAKLRSDFRSSTAKVEGVVRMVQMQSLPATEQAVGQAAGQGTGHAMTQVLDSMQQQGWNIVCPQDTFATSGAGAVSGVCAVMVGKLSRHPR